MESTRLFAHGLVCLCGSYTGISIKLRIFHNLLKVPCDSLWRWSKYEKHKMNFPWRQHTSCYFTVLDGRMDGWTDIAAPVYYPVQLPWQQPSWQPAPSPLSGVGRGQRDHREHPVLVCSPLPPRFSSPSSVGPCSHPFFIWSVTSKVHGSGYYCCHVNSLSCGYACDSAVCRGRVWDKKRGTSERVNSVVQDFFTCFVLFCFVCQISLISTIPLSLYKREGWKWKIKCQHCRGRRGKVWTRSRRDEKREVEIF